MRWQPLAVPPSAVAFLDQARVTRKGQRREFSRTQEFVAALYWFTTLPLVTQLKIVRALESQLAKQDPFDTLSPWK
jgi:hypothetical protein